MMKCQKADKLQPGRRGEGENNPKLTTLSRRVNGEDIYYLHASIHDTSAFFSFVLYLRETKQMGEEEEEIERTEKH